MMQDEEETKQESDANGLNEFGLGFSNGNKNGAQDDSEDDSESDYDNAFEISVTVDLLKSPITLVDEFAFFSEAISKMANMRPQDIVAIFKDMNENDKKQLREMLQTKRISLVGNEVI
jgi:hypothetical protein